jgi:hypothetical protein
MNGILDHFSTVTLHISNTEDGATVNVNQSGVPSGQEDAIKRNWMGYYWKPMEATLSAGIFDSMPIQTDTPFTINSKWMVAMVTLIILLIAITAFAVAPKL